MANLSELGTNIVKSVRKSVPVSINGEQRLADKTFQLYHPFVAEGCDELLLRHKGKVTKFFNGKPLIEVTNTFDEVGKQAQNFGKIFDILKNKLSPDELKGYLENAGWSNLNKAYQKTGNNGLFGIFLTNATKGQNAEAFAKSNYILEKYYQKLLAFNPQSKINPQIKAQEELAKLYNDVAESAAKDGNTKRQGIYAEFAQKSSNGEFKGDDVYTKLINETYNKLRNANYPITDKFDPKIAEFTAKNTPKIEVRDENSWHYRIPNNRNANGWSTSDKSLDRISVNANTDKKLVEALDDLFGDGQIKGYFKTPSDSASWLCRHDPITIYLHEKATPEVLAKIENITKPYIRSTEDVLHGKKFAPGLALEQSPQIDDINAVIAQADKIDPTAAQAVRVYLSNRKGEPSASAGQLNAVKKVLNMFS